MAHDYDIILVGGGLGGAALGKSLAERGVQVLILEREMAFRDRVRGEYMHPWGVTETRSLGLYELLKQSCGFEAQFRVSQILGAPPTTRDLVATSPHHAGSLHFYHPEMQEVLLAAALRAGATVRRGVAAIEVSPGLIPSVRVRTGESEEKYQARLVVGADGRDSACRRWAGFTVNRDAHGMVMAGVLFNGLSTPAHAVHTFTNPSRSEFAFQIPLGGTRFRCYAGYYQQEGRQRLSGRKGVADFIAMSVSAGAPREWFASAEVAGPLASFDGTVTWIAHPYGAGVVLIGDAAATSDPTFGSGLSLTLRDVRVLSNLLLREVDWHAASHAYAAEHDRYFGSLHRQVGWMTQLLYEPGPVAAARRERAFARLAEDPRRALDIPGLGPESPNDDAAYRNLFGED
jgi:2-polyprenyl-6-methoxyphenol hydroxylase-like FAD-dependent oxidoreductase